ncbi:YdiU family protein [Francisellaceae bacterium CB300]
MQNIELEYSYSSLAKEFYSDQPVYKYPNAKVVVLNDALASELGMNFEESTQDDVLNFLLGYTSKKPISQAYAGHQFGHFTMLGDGRAILLGEYTKPNGEIVDIQLKGAGRTTYSRGGDGKATLQSMLREYIVSEAMHNLGIATSRILAVILTGENIERNSLEHGAIAVRVTSSHIRVGTFQYAATQGKNYAKGLLDYTLKRHNIPYINNKALSLLRYVVEKQSSLIVEWERVGFIHGVMNTDNMTISGETIDYGPCAFMDEYDPETVFSSIDRNGRYAFANQASIAGWNIARLAESLLPLIADDEDDAIKLAQEVLATYAKSYSSKWQEMFLSKLGLEGYQANDDELISELLVQMNTNKLDYTNTFYNITHQNLEILKNQGLAEWLNKWKLRAVNIEKATLIMNKSNPVLIPRNHQVEKVLKAAQNSDLNLMNNFVRAVSKPYEFSQETEKLMALPFDDERVMATFCGV